MIVNFAISTTDRVVRTVRTSLEQRKREMQLARRQACALLKAELKDNLTSLSRSCQMGLQDASLTTYAVEQIRRIEEIGKDMQEKLAAEDLQEATAAAHA